MQHKRKGRHTGNGVPQRALMPDKGDSKMSAFFVGEDHVNAMLTWCENCRTFGVPTPSGERKSNPSDRDLTAIGRELLAENVKSLAARYPDDYQDLVDCEVESFKYVPDYHYTSTHKAVDLLKLIDCYEYQSCEHNAWGESWAHEFCQWLRGNLISNLPGYENASWGYSKPKMRRKW